MKMYLVDDRRNLNQNVKQLSFTKKDVENGVVAPKTFCLSLIDCIFDESLPNKPIFIDDMIHIRECVDNPLLNCEVESIDFLMDVFLQNPQFCWFQDQQYKEMCFGINPNGAKKTKECLPWIVERWWERCLGKELLMMESVDGAFLPKLKKTVKNCSNKSVFPAELVGWIG